MAKTREKVASSASKTIEFFKVYLPQFSSRRLLLPPALVGILNKSLPHEATLQDETGRSWPVTIEEERKPRVLIANGWRNFAIHHSLEYGDFLVFNYDGNSSFFVKIFGKNGFRKGLGVASNVLSNEESDVEPENVANKSIPHRCGSLPRKAKICKGPSDVEPCEMNCVPMVKCEDEEEGVEIGEAVNPHYVKKIAPSARYMIDIPKTFLRFHRIQLGKNVELSDEKGKKWPVTVRSTARRAYMSSGWGSFWRSHRLGKKNKCVFKFILGRGTRKCEEIHVQIFDADLETELKNRWQTVDV